MSYQTGGGLIFVTVEVALRQSRNTLRMASVFRIWLGMYSTCALTGISGITARAVPGRIPGGHRVARAGHDEASSAAFAALAAMMSIR